MSRTLLPASLPLSLLAKESGKSGRQPRRELRSSDEILGIVSRKGKSLSPARTNDETSPLRRQTSSDAITFPSVFFSPSFFSALLYVRRMDTLAKFRVTKDRTRRQESERVTDPRNRKNQSREEDRPSVS